jgi:acyl carrier protein
VANLADLVTTTILQCLAQALKISVDTIDRREPFSDYGLDSILGVSFVKNLNDGLGINLHTTVLFDHTTVDRLARYVVKTHSDHIKVTGATAAIEPAPAQLAPPPCLPLGHRHGN